jgi:hypothetical protein
MFRICLESTDKNASSEENDLDDQNGEVGGLFRISQRKKIGVNDQEDYTLNQPNEKRNWDLDEVCKEKLLSRYNRRISCRFVILFGIVL